MKHTYYRILFRAKSAFSIGSGRNARTDHDIMRRKDGTPYIPAASIAGVFRHYYDGDEKLQDQLFGSIKTVKQHTSALFFYDADLTGKCDEIVRDSVKLENRTAVKGAKFDMEAVEAGAEFVTYLELDKYHEQYTAETEMLLTAMKNGILRFGYKSTRGYGEVEILEVKRMQFELGNPAGLDAWLAFEMKDAAGWDHAESLALDTHPENMLCIRLHLRQQSALSIRVYSTDPGKDHQKFPDFKQMAMQNGDPVIPGTSWAGAFRERFRQLSADEPLTNGLFGELNGDVKRSRILFSESQIRGGMAKEMTRNSIDRFSAATKNTALYTERTWYGGETELTLTIPHGTSPKERLVLGAVLLDLHNGYLSLGGLASVGRGMFRIEQIEVNGSDRTVLLEPAGLAALLEV